MQPINNFVTTTESIDDELYNFLSTTIPSTEDIDEFFTYPPNEEIDEYFTTLIVNEGEDDEYLKTAVVASDESDLFIEATDAL
jgi:hypothetical protein